MRYWKLDDESAVESHSNSHDVPFAHEISKEECDAYIRGLPPEPVEPIRDLAAEIDDIVKRIDAL